MLDFSDPRSPVGDANPLPPGALLADGKYRVIRRLGAGAFGQVYLAVHQSLGVERALKVLARSGPNVGSADFTRFRERFRLEAQLGARLNHPSVHPYLLQVHDF